MAGEVGEAFVKVRPETSGFGNEAKTKVDGALKTVAKLAATTLAVGGATDFLKHSIDNAIKFQEQMAGLQNTLKNVGQGTDKAKKEAENYTEALSKASGFARSDVVQSLQRATVGTGNLGKAMQVETTAANLARTLHIGLAQATLLTTKAFDGNTSSLKRLGINFSPVTAAHDALIKKVTSLQIAEKTATGATKAKDVAEIANLKTQAAAAVAADKTATTLKVQKKLTDLTADGMKKFGETTAGKMALAQNAVDNLEEKIGTALLPAIGSLASTGAKYIDKLDAAWPKISAAISKVIDDVKSAVDSIAGHVGGIGKLETAAKIFVGTLIALATAAKVASIAMSVLDAVTEANPLVLVGIAIAAVAAGLYLLYERSAQARAIMNAVWSDLQSAGKTALTWLSQVGIPAVTAEFDRLAPRVEGDIRQVITVIKEFVSQVRQNWGTITSILGPVVQLAITVVKTIITTELHEIEKTIDLFGNILHGRWGAAWGDLKDIVKTAIEAAVTIVTSTLSTLVQTVDALGQAVGHQIARGIKSAATDLVGLAGDIASKLSSAVSEVAGQALSYGEKIGEQIVTGVVKGLAGLPGKVASAIGGALPGGNSAIQSTAKKIAAGTGQAFIQSFPDILSQIAANVKGLGSEVANALTNQVKDGIVQAKQNLTGLGSTLAGSIGQIIDQSTSVAISKIPAALTAAIGGVNAGTSLSDASAKIAADQAAKQQRSLEAALKSANAAATAGPALGQTNPDGTPITADQLASQQADLNQAAKDAQTDLDDFLLQARINKDQAKHDQDVQDAQDAATIAKKSVNDQIELWTQQFNAGKLSQQDYLKDINGLAGQYGDAGTTLGDAFATTFAAQIQTIVNQVGAIAAAAQPGVGGSGLLGSVTDPLSSVISKAAATTGTLKTDATNVAAAKAAIKAANSTYDTNVKKDRADAAKLAQDATTYEAQLKAANAQLTAAEKSQTTDQAILAALRIVIQQSGQDPDTAIAAAAR